MAITTKNSNGGVVYLQVDYGKRSLYIYSATPKEGFEEHTSSKGNTSYRMYVSNVTGMVENAYFRDSNLGGQEFVLVLRDGDEKYSASFGIDGSAFTNLARGIENVDTSKLIQLSVYVGKGKGGKTYLNVGLSYPDILNEKGNPTFVEWGDEYPAPRQLKSGKWDFSDIEEEAYLRAKKFIDDNGFEDARQQPSVEAEPEPVAPKATKEDLPF